MPGDAECQAEATGPARRQGTHHPPPNRLANETDSTTDEEPCRPRRRGINGDRRVPHTRRSLNSAQKRSLRSPLTLELLGKIATDRDERGRRQDADRKAAAMSNGPPAVRDHALTCASTTDPLRMTATIRVSVMIGIDRRSRAIAMIVAATTIGILHRACWQASGCGKCEAISKFGSQRLVTKYCSTGLARR